MRRARRNVDARRRNRPFRCYHGDTVSAPRFLGLVLILTTAFALAGPISLRATAAANPVYACDERGAKLDVRAGRPVCVNGSTTTDATEVGATTEAARQKLLSAQILFYFVLGTVLLVLLCALLQFRGVGEFARRRAKLADVIANAPTVAVANAEIADRMVSPESARMIVQTSQTGLALVVVVLLFFFGYLTTMFAASFAAPDRPVATAAPAATVHAKPTPKPTPKPAAKR